MSGDELGQKCDPNQIQTRGVSIVPNWSNRWSGETKDNEVAVNRPCHSPGSTRPELGLVSISSWDGPFGQDLGQFANRPYICKVNLRV